MAATTPIIPRVIRTSARVNATLFLCEKWDVKRGKTVSEKLLRYWGTRVLSSLCGKLFPLFVKIFDLKSQLITESHPSLKFLNSYNSLRNFFSPSRGEILISFNVSSGGGNRWSVIKHFKLSYYFAMTKLSEIFLYLSRYI